MTKAYIKKEAFSSRTYEEWDNSIIAPKFSLKNFSDELHFYLRIYLLKDKPLVKILIFLFLNAIQRVFYTIGNLIVKLTYPKKN